MSYTDLLESKHHYLTMLKDADASRRAIERDFTPNKANEYNKIMAIRNTAFINLIKEDVPYVENEEKESVRIEIDGEGYDMKKSKLKLLVGDEVYERILARSHEHAQTLSNLKDNEADIPEYQTPRIGQTMPQQPASGQYQQPYGCGQQGMQQMPYGYMQPQMPNPYQPYGYGNYGQQMPYGYMQPQMPMQPQIPPQDNSQIYGAIGELTNKLNEISARVKPETQIKEVVIDDQIREQLKLSRDELEKAKKAKSEAIEKAHDALKDLAEAKSAMEVEKTKQQMLSGDVESLTKQKELLQKRLDEAKDAEEKEKHRLNEKIEALNSEKRDLESRHAREINDIKSRSEAEIARKKDEISQARSLAQKQADERITQLINDKDKKIKEAEEKLAAKDAEYKRKISEANRQIADIRSNADNDTKSIQSENDRKVDELTKQLDAVAAERDKVARERDTMAAERDRIKQSYFDKYNAAKQKINEAVQRAENAEADLEKQKKMSADQKQQNIKDNENITRAMNEQAREIRERTRQKVENIKAQTKQQIDKLTARNRRQMDEYEQGIKEKEAELLAKENELNAKRSEIEQVKSEYSKNANEIRRKADEKARQIQEQLNDTLSKNEEYKNKLKEINEESQSMLERFNNQISEKENEFARKENELRQLAEKEKEDALRKLQEEFEEKQREMEERHKAELESKKTELEEAKETIEESKEQINNLNEAVQVHTQLAYYDKLTGLMNNNKLSKDFKEMSVPTFAMVCINDMKSLNAQNKSIGDNAIKFIGNQLKERLSENTYRSMGDIFAVISDDEADEVSQKLDDFKNSLATQNGLYIAYGVVSEDECEKNQMPQLVRDRMNEMRTQNRVIIAKLKEEAKRREDMRRQYEETKQRNEAEADSLIDIQEVQSNNGKIVTRDISADETYYETILNTGSVSNSSEQPHDDFDEGDDEDIYENL